METFSPKACATTTAPSMMESEMALLDGRSALSPRGKRRFRRVRAIFDYPGVSADRNRILFAPWGMKLPDALLLNDEANNTGPVSSEVEGVFKPTIS